MERTDYRFTLTRDTDTFEVFPEDFFDGNFKYTQNEGQMFFRKEYDGTLCFKKTDYAYIKDRYDDGYYCDIYELLIEKKISGVYQVDWTGYFSMTDGKFDFERCRYFVTPTVDDKYSCILRNWEKEVNIFNIDLQKYPIGCFAISNLEFQFKYGFQTEISLLQNMTLWRNGSGCIGTPADQTPLIYAREAILLPKSLTPSGGGWLLWNEDDESLSSYGINQVFNLLSPNLEQKKWVRDYSTNYLSSIYYDLIGINEGTLIPLQDILDNCFSGSASNYDKIASIQTQPATSPETIMSFFKLKTFEINAITDVEFSYIGFKLMDILKGVINNTCNDSYLIESNFFTNSTNPVTGIASKTNNLYLIQKSDAKRPNASNSATIGNITFKDLMDILYYMFQVWWDIDDSLNLILKHQSEIEGIQGLNISVAPYINTTAHYKVIEFNKSILYRFEKWTFMESKGIDFIGLPIEYNELCTIKENDSKTKNYEINLITTDISYIQIGGDNISDDGFAFVSTDISNNIIIEEGIISGINQLNGHLSIANLHDNYWKHNRILSTGTMNGTLTTFISSQKIRKLQELTIKYCDEFDPTEEITTELGNAIVNEATFKPLDQTLTLNMSI